MAALPVTYTVSWDPVPGSYGYLVEYKLSADTDWTTPVTSTNPTLYLEYNLQLMTGNTYDVRISSVGLSCTTKYTNITINT